MTKDDVVPVSQLHRAVENGQINGVRKILAQRTSCVDVPNRYGQTALKLAILKNNTSLMGILLNSGADLDNLEAGSERTPLMAAASKGYAEAIQALLDKGSSLKTKDRNGCSVLNYAVDNSHLELVRLALEKGADLRIKDKSGWSPLMRGVILRSSLEVLSCLLENGSDVNEMDDGHQTLLMQAVLSGRSEVVELLLQYGADTTVRNLCGHSAYDMAKNSMNDGIIKISHLLNEGQESTKSDVHGTNVKENEPRGD